MISVKSLLIFYATVTSQVSRIILTCSPLSVAGRSESAKKTTDVSYTSGATTTTTTTRNKKTVDGDSDERPAMLGSYFLTLSILSLFLVNCRNIIMVVENAFRGISLLKGPMIP